MLTALGRVNEPSITRTVIAFETLWLRRAASLGPVYRGARPPTLHARVVALARHYNDLLTPEPGPPPPLPEAAVATLARELADPTDRTILRMLVAALGLFPVGTVVQLSSGEVGEVISANRGRAQGKPLLRVSMGTDGGVLATPVEVDLARAGEVRSVVRVLSIEGWVKGLEADQPRPGAADSSYPSHSAVVPTEPPSPRRAAAPAVADPTASARLARGSPGHPPSRRRSLRAPRPSYSPAVLLPSLRYRSRKRSRSPPRPARRRSHPSRWLLPPKVSLPAPGPPPSPRRWGA